MFLEYNCIQSCLLQISKTSAIIPKKLSKYIYSMKISNEFDHNIFNNFLRKESLDFLFDFLKKNPKRFFPKCIFHGTNCTFQIFLVINFIIC